MLLIFNKYSPSNVQKVIQGVRECQSSTWAKEEYEEEEETAAYTDEWMKKGKYVVGVG